MPPSLAPRRIMKTADLMGGTSIYNLLIDPTFAGGEPGIGRWYTSFSGTVGGDGPGLGQLMVAASPSNIALPVGTVSDFGPKGGGAPRSMSLLAQVVGGKGPYSVKVWISADDLPDESVAPLTLVRVTLAAAAGVGLTGVDVPLDETSRRKLGGRTWTRFSGDVPGPFTLGAYVVIRIKGSKHQWWMQAPEVVPLALLPGGGVEAKSSVLHPVLRRELDDDERLAIDGYRKQLFRSGPPMPPPSRRVP